MFLIGYYLHWAVWSILQKLLFTLLYMKAIVLGEVNNAFIITKLRKIPFNCANMRSFSSYQECALRWRICGQVF